jgi:competence protein ComEC
MSFFGMFIGFVIGLIGGVVGVYQLPFLLPWFSFVFAGLLALGCLWRCFNKRAAHAMAGFIIGAILATLFGFLRPSLEPLIPGQVVWIEAEVVSLVEQRVSARSLLRFDVELSRVSTDQQHWQSLSARRIRLSCYDCAQVPQSGERWRWPVKLQPIHAMMNPVGLDYEAWAYQAGLAGRGYVSDPALAQRVATGWNIHLMRQQVAQTLAPLWQDSPFRGIYQALLYGDKSAISQLQWEVLRQTATIHLMAISGLHLALIAAMSYVIGRVVWRAALVLPFVASWPQVWVGAMFAALAVTGYAMLAGWTVPTQRAWIMVMVGLAFIALRRKFQPWPTLALAAALVLIYSPSAVLSAGFWLSFLAVALIFSVLAQPWLKSRRVWQQTLVVQLVLSLALLPSLWFFYQQLPLYGVLANVFAVPFVSFLALPLVFLQALFQYFVPDIALYLAKLSDVLWHGFWWALTQIGAWPYAVVTLPPIAGQWVLLAYAALFALLGFQQAWLKWLSLLVLAVALVWPLSLSPSLGLRAFRVTLLDVGQGQALVVETRHHVLVYDAGPRWGNSADAAQFALVPYLQAGGYEQVDALIISHADNDHAGGAESVLAAFAVNTKLSGQVERLGLKGFEACESGMSWQWDGVRFDVLHPDQQPVGSHNDASCVLRVSVGSQALMVSGDLSRTYEKRLVARYPQEALRSQILIAGHHGSEHSTDEVFLRALQPELVLFSSGYANRFGFPKPAVIARVEQQGAAWFNTACDGAIQIDVQAQSWHLVTRARPAQARWYHHQCTTGRE